MNIRKKVKKFWSGSASFTVSEIFSSVSDAAKQTIPSDAATYEVDGKPVSFEFARIKEVENNADALPASGSKDPGKGKGEKKLEHKDNKAVKK